MTTIVLFHHVLGITSGIKRMVTLLENQGYDVLTPDFFDGRTFDTTDEGLTHVEAIGQETLFTAADKACKGLEDFVVIGLSLGAMLAQAQLQTNTNVQSAFLIHSLVDPAYLPGEFPKQTPIHFFGMKEDPYFIEDGGVQLLEKLQPELPNLHAYLYEGNKHLFAEPAQPDFDAQAAQSLETKILKALLL